MCLWPQVQGALMRPAMLILGLFIYSLVTLIMHGGFSCSSISGKQEAWLS